MARFLTLATALKITVFMATLLACLVVLAKTRVLDTYISESAARYSAVKPVYREIPERSAKNRTLTNKDSFEEEDSTENEKSEDYHSEIDSNIDDELKADKLDETEYFGGILEAKLSAARDVKVETFKPTCRDKFSRANSCEGSKYCLQTQLPDDPKARVEQLVGPKRLRLNPRQNDLLRKMASRIAGNYDIVLLTTASSNHFNESQALMRTVHERLFPLLTNFTFVFYDIGLTSRERELMIKNCRCQFLDFPFQELPEFIRELRCYSWKPVMIKAALPRANFVVWMDASVRFFDLAGNIKVILEQARERGLQIGGNNVISAFRTFRSMYHFFGDEPCAYFPLGMAKATFGVYHREEFVDRVILEPWAACALNADCMCPADRFMGTCRQSKDMFKLWREQNKQIAYGLCHLYDQSAISLILHKLYQEKYRWVYCNTNFFSRIQRDDLDSYFA